MNKINHGKMHILFKNRLNCSKKKHYMHLLPKYWILLIIFFTAVNHLLAGVVCSFKLQEAESNNCIQPNVISQYPQLLAAPSPLALKIANDAMAAAWPGIKPNIMLYSAPTMCDNAFFGQIPITTMTTFGPIVQYVPAVVYSPKFLTELHTKHGPAAVLAIFAHEIAHAMSRFFNWSLYNFESHQEERRADFIAGYVVARWKGNRISFEQAIIPFSQVDDGYHATWEIRIADFRAGWIAGGGNIFW